MRVTMLSAVIVIVSGFVSAARADIAPGPGPGPQNLDWPEHWAVTQGPQPQLQIRDADVKVNLSRAGDGAIMAKVSCTFEMKCVRGIASPVSRSLLFPMYEGARTDKREKEFSVKADGKQLPKFRATWTPKGSLQKYVAFQFNSSFTKDQTQKITVDYSLLLPMQDNQAKFTYILRSAAEWSGPVVQETVRVKADKGLEIKAIVAPDGKLKVKEQQGELVWVLKNAVPTEDINVGIATTAGN